MKLFAAAISSRDSSGGITVGVQAFTAESFEKAKTYSLAICKEEWPSNTHHSYSLKHIDLSTLNLSDFV